MVTVAPGRHRKPAPELQQASAGMPFNSARHRQPLADTDHRADPDWRASPREATPWPPQWDAPPPELHPDHPSAPVPRVRVAGPVRGRAAPGFGPASDYGPAGYYAPAHSGWHGHDRRDSGSFALAEQLLTNADSQAATITQDALSQAIAIRDAAEQDAAVIRQQASAIRAAAEQEAAEMRAAILAMSEQLGRLATYVTENFAIPAGTPTALRATTPAALVPAPAAAPPARPARTASRPARPANRAAAPAIKSSRSTAQPVTGTRGRQARSARKMMALLAAMLMVGAASGATELVLHGVPFYLFRANGTGASETGPKENQGPGQPDAPGAHHSPPGQQHK